MEWTITEGDLSQFGRTPVAGFVERMERELRGGGGPIEGFQFVNTTEEMLRFTREIEDEVLDNPDGANLYTGFQTSAKFDMEIARYEDILRTGARVAAYGQGPPPDGFDAGTFWWVELPRDTRALENQWFLVSTAPTPIVFVGWETSPDDRFGTGGLSAPGKTFEGFVTTDRRVVDAIVEHLHSVMYTRTRLTCGEPGIEEDDGFHREDGEQGDHPYHGQSADFSGWAKGWESQRDSRIMALTDFRGSPEYAAVRDAAAAMAIARGCELVLFEVSAASYLVNPYPEDDRSHWQRILNEQELMLFGRGEVARQWAKVREQGVPGGVILPSMPGFKHLDEWADREKIDLIMVPASLVRPGLLARLQGYSLRTLLRHTDRRVMVVDAEGTMCWASNPAADDPEDCMVARPLGHQGARP